MNAVKSYEPVNARSQESLLARARRGDAEACVALFDEIAPDIYRQVILEVHEPALAERITEESLVAMVGPLTSGQVSSVTGLRWQVASRAMHQASRQSRRGEQMSIVRTAVRHLVSVMAAGSIVIYAGLNLA
jgi:DNA-directed RNA polymerase specialized sigma24 family protein